MITNIHKNCMGTTSFNGKFGKMRKEQDFIVYPIQSSDTGKSLIIQSEHRFASIKIDNGETVMSANHAQYANSMALQIDIMKGKAERFTLDKEVLEPLLAFIRGTAGDKVGNNSMNVFCDNSNANLV